MRTRTVTKREVEQMVSYYLNNLSAREVKEILGIKLSVRQIQRILKANGVIRSQGDSFRLAVKLGKVDYKRENAKKTHVK